MTGLALPRPGQVPRPAVPYAVGSRSGTMPVSNLAAPVLIYSQPVSIAPGKTVTLTPEAPSPVAGYALCNQPGYEIVFAFQQPNAGSVMPFVQVTVSWFDQDSQTAPAVDTIVWYLPGGTANPAPVYGNGQLRGQYMQVTVQNQDLVYGVTGSVQMSGVSRVYKRDDWRWTGPQSVVGYTRPLLGPAQGTLLLAASAPPVIGPGNSVAHLLPLFAGKVRMWFSATGLATQNAVLSFYSTNAAPNTLLYQYALGNNPAVLYPQPELSFFREPHVMTMSNTASTGFATFQVVLTAEEY